MKGLLRDFSRRSKSKLLRDCFTLEQIDCGLTMQLSCLKSKPNMLAGAKGDTPEVVCWYLNMIHIQTQQTSSTRCRELSLIRSDFAEIHKQILNKTWQ